MDFRTAATGISNQRFSPSFAPPLTPEREHKLEHRLKDLLGQALADLRQRRMDRGRIGQRVAKKLAQGQAMRRWLSKLSK